MFFHCGRQQVQTKEYANGYKHRWQNIYILYLRKSRETCVNEWSGKSKTTACLFQLLITIETIETTKMVLNSNLQLKAL